MLKAIVPRLTYANVVASLALFLALGGVGFAAAQLPKNSVGPSALKKNAVTTDKLANNAVTGAKVKTRSLDGTDIDLGKLGTVPTAAAVAKITYKTAVASIPAATGTPINPSATATATCDPGQAVLGGGVHVDSDVEEIVNDTHPSGTTGWTGVVYNAGPAPHNMTVTAICAPVAATG